MSVLDAVREELVNQQAHQLTLTGTTFPFVDHLHFAATLDPKKRKYSLYAGLWLMRPGDLLFFYQSDPKVLRRDIYGRAEMNRGIRGIYRVTGPWQRHAGPIPCPIGRETYPLYGCCPTCANENRTSYEVDSDSEQRLVCASCGNPAPSGDAMDGRGRTPGLILGLVCPIEPLCVFANTVPQSVAYGDRTHRPMLWTGRHDNAMGRGKGSTARHPLPEESLRLTEMLEAENPRGPEQRAGSCLLPFTPALDENGQSLTCPRLKRRGPRYVMEGGELAINAEQSRQIRDLSSALRQACDEIARGSAMRFSMAVSELPVGYTASSPDFVVIYSSADDSERLVFAFENKLEATHLESAGQLHNYIPWVAQMLANEGAVRAITMQPLLCGARQARDLLLTGPYFFVLPTFGTEVRVEAMRVLQYAPAPDPIRVGDVMYTESLSWTDVSERCPAPRRMSVAPLLPCTIEDSRETARLIREAPEWR